MKNKTLLALIPTALIASPVLANDSTNDWFVGGAINKQMSKSEQAPGAMPADTSSFDQKDRDWGYELKAGRYLGDNDQHRLTMTYTEANGGSKTGDYDQKNLLASYDYMYSLTDDNSWRAFGGVSAGMANTKYDGAGTSNDLVYGAQAGLNYRINQQWETEIGYRYLKQDYSGTNGNTGEQFALDRTEQVFMGVNYRF
ncbi:porin family protein [Neiella marina]|uniref:Porin family protein n=1 Tax=Neiella holothuriorum TaxID=2870530 RepID=A0ABS7EF86_9GAMM|nr:outer membrane beta-barrel protein [Neiella holothuriorum]MBW8190998.1 porin family protein [Neiella holothuriorum]